jgi:hypothetical protein
MSYIVAYIKFPLSDKTYPVSCFRSDLAVNDRVIVRRIDGSLCDVIVTELQYLNWDCRAKIECKTSESSIDDNDQIILPNNSPMAIGMVTADVFIANLKERGWIPIRPRQNLYKAMVVNTNNTQTAYIFSRRNGIDIQLLPTASEKKPRAFSPYQGSLTEGRVVRHYLAYTSFNLFEGVIRFSNSFLQNEPNLDQYFVPVGCKDKRNDKLKAMGNSTGRIRDEMDDIYDACSSGDGGDAYLGDGVWITPGGGHYQK